MQATSTQQWRPPSTVLLFTTDFTTAFTTGIGELVANPSNIDTAVEASFDRIDMRFLERLNERIQQDEQQKEVPCVRACACACVYTYTYIHGHVCMYVYMYVCVCVCVCVYIYMYIYIYYIYIYIFIYIYIYAVSRAAF
jgi:hypothetical protein